MITILRGRCLPYAFSGIVESVISPLWQSLLYILQIIQQRLEAFSATVIFLSNFTPLTTI